MPAVQRLGGEIGVTDVAVAREGQGGDRLVRGFECRAQTCCQSALAGAVDAFDHDEHAAKRSAGR